MGTEGKHEQAQETQSPSVGSRSRGPHDRKPDGGAAEMTEIHIEANTSKKFDISFSIAPSNHPYYLDIEMDHYNVTIYATDEYFLDLYEALKNHLQSRGRLE
jgi:hypothetical protein